MSRERARRVKPRPPKCFRKPVDPHPAVPANSARRAGCFTKKTEASIPSPLAGEGGRRPDEGEIPTASGRAPLIRPFGAPSPARGEGEIRLRPSQAQVAPNKDAWRRLLAGWLIVLAFLPSRALAQQPTADDAPLGLADLAAERAALSGKFDNDEPPRPTTFRALWDHPDDHRGRRVIVSGRIVRIFRQDAVGDFPALVEAWIEEPPGNLFCAVFEPRPDLEIKTGPLVAFTGVYLRRVRYEAGGGSRLAPLIVGPEPPTIQKPAPTDDRKETNRPAAPAGPWSSLGRSLALLVALAAIAALLARRTLSSGQQPRRRRRSIDADTVPEFLDPEPADDDPR